MTRSLATAFLAEKLLATEVSYVVSPASQPKAGPSTHDGMQAKKIR
jgi:hypothetical protein